MGKPNLPKYGIAELYLFRPFQTREDYQVVTGAEASWDSRREPKYWFDPMARLSTSKRVVYARVLVVDEKGLPVAGLDGKPQIDVLVLTKEEAATVNIPPTGIGVTNILGAEVTPMQCPMRELMIGEELIFDPNMPGVVSVKNSLHPYWLTEAVVGFTANDRRLLIALAEKQGIK